MSSIQSTNNYCESFSVHKRKHFGEKPYKCDMCNAAFSQNCNLTVHKRIHYENNNNKCENKSFQCNMCKAEFKHFGTLRKHERYHFAEKTNADGNTYVTKNFGIHAA